MLKGWKSYLGAGLVGVGFVVGLMGWPEIGKIVVGLGGALGIVGIRAKIERCLPVED